MRTAIPSLAVILLFAAVSTAPSQLRAQEQSDVHWQMAPRGVLADERIQYALLLLTDTEPAAADAGLQGAIVYGNPEYVEFVAQIDDAEAEADLLLAAAGFADPPSQLSEARRCRVWVDPDASDPAALAAAGEALGAALSDAWARLGVEVQPCETTADRDGADLLVWESGRDQGVPEGVFLPDADSYLVAADAPPRAAPGGNDAGGVAPPPTGDAGLR